MNKTRKQISFKRNGNYREMYEKAEARKLQLNVQVVSLGEKVIAQATEIGELKASESEKVVKLRNELSASDIELNIAQSRVEKLEKLWFVKLFRL